MRITITITITTPGTTITITMKNGTIAMKVMSRMNFLKPMKITRAAKVVEKVEKVKIKVKSNLQVTNVVPVVANSTALVIVPLLEKKAERQQRIMLMQPPRSRVSLAPRNQSPGLMDMIPPGNNPMMAGKSMMVGMEIARDSVGAKVKVKALRGAKVKVEVKANLVPYPAHVFHAVSVNSDLKVKVKVVNTHIGKNQNIMNIGRHMSIFQTLCVIRQSQTRQQSMTLPKRAHPLLKVL